MFSASTTYEKQLRIEKTRLSHQVWSHGGSTFKKKDIKRPFFRPAETDPYVHMFNFYWIQPSGNGGGYDNDGSPKIVGNLSLGFLSKYVSGFPDNVVCAFTST